MQIYYEGDQACLFDQEYSCGKMYPGRSPLESRRVKTSASFLKRYLKYVCPTYMFLDLTPGNTNLLGGYEWEIRSPWDGECLMLNTGVSPRDEIASSLSQILEDSPHLKYYLSPKSCMGILRRSLEHGKPLPERLQTALLIQAGVGDCRDMPPAVARLYENHGIDSRYRGPFDISPTLSARAGTGGNNLPIVDDAPLCIAGNSINRQPQNGGNGQGVCENVAFTLTAFDRHAVFNRRGAGAFQEGMVAATQTARQYKDATDLVYDGANPFACLIRRLTPLECERLQGFPDGWTNVPNSSDSARYKALGNSVAIPCVDYIMHGVALALNSA